MPLIVEEKNNLFSVFVWEISETVEELSLNMHISSSNQKKISERKKEIHKKQFLSIMNILKKIDVNHDSIYYNKNGKPLLEKGKNISFSHSENFSVVAVSNNNIGVDIETKFDTILKVKCKFLNENEISYFNTKKKLVSSWCAKESIYKILNKKIPLKNIPLERDFSCNLENTHYKSYIKFIKNFCLSVSLEV